MVGLVRRAAAAGALAALVLVGGVAEVAAQSRPAAIDRNGILILIRSTILALQQANQTGNYTVLRDLGAPGFQTTNSAARLSDIFASLRNQHLDLSGVLAIDPQLTTLPEINGAGQLRVAGFFPSAPLQITFDLLFAANHGQWQPLGVTVNIGQPTPVPPEGAAPGKPAP